MNLRVRLAELRLRNPFTISRGTQEAVRTVLVEVEAGGITGHGEASPSSYYGHSPESIGRSLEKARPVLIDADPLRWRRLLGDLASAVDGDRAALAALDLAIHDWAGKRLGLPLHRLLGLDPRMMPRSSFTIGIDSIPRMVEKTLAARGYPILKIKLGTPDDLGLVRALRGASEAVFRVDANCAWNAAEAIEKSRALAALGVEFIEQPLPPQKNDEMVEVRRQSALPIFADESAVVPEDVPGLAGRFDGIVVKLVKCGGLLPALRMIETARAMGLKVMLGCMIESSVSISAAAQIGPLADHLDIDGALLISNDPFEGVGNVYGQIILTDRPGLGVTPLPAAGLTAGG
jgi:L-Ala-D/L-Glu epimerase / N-acetyl-D-glutamate racemase